MVNEVQISLALEYYFKILSARMTVRLSWSFEYHKFCEINKMGDDFFIDFSFFTQIFHKNFLNFFFSQVPDAAGVCGTMSKVTKKKTQFGGIHSFLCRMLGLK